MDSTGYYYPVGGSSRVDATLNTLAARYGYKTWDRYLNLATPKNIHIHIGDPVNYDKDAIAGNPLQECGVSSEAFKYHFFAKGATPSVSNEYKKTTIINDDVDLVPYFMIEINSGLNGTFYVEAISGKTLEECGIASELFEYHLFEEGADPATSDEFFANTVIERDLDLVTYYMITVEEEEERERYYVESETDNNNLFDNVESLDKYRDSDEFVVGDSEHNNVLTVQSSITGDMVIVVMKRNTVVIALDESVVFYTNEVNLSEVAHTISDLTGIDMTVILIELESDEQGFVIRVTAIMNDVDKCELTVDAINHYSNCESSDILCHSHAKTLDDSSDDSSNNGSSDNDDSSENSSSNDSSNNDGSNNSSSDSESSNVQSSSDEPPKNQTNNCIEVGNITLNKCREDQICVNDECVSNKTSSDSWSVEIEVKINSTELNTTEILEIISSITGIDPDKLNIATTADEDGSNLHVIIFVEEEGDAMHMIDTINSCSSSGSSTNCDIFGRAKMRSGINTKHLSLSCAPFFNDMNIFYVMMVIYAFISC